MSEAAAAAESERIVDKLRLCEELKWSRMKLDRRLESDPNFPVRSRGTQAGGWSFDLDAVLEYLGDDADAEADEAIGVSHAGEQTARQRRDAAQAQLLEDKIRKQRGELVDVNELRMVLSEGVARLSVQLNKLAETLVRRLNLPDSSLPIIQQEIDEARRHLVVAMKSLKSGD